MGHLVADRAEGVAFHRVGGALQAVEPRERIDDDEIDLVPMPVVGPAPATTERTEPEDKEAEDEEAAVEEAAARLGKSELRVSTIKETGNPAMFVKLGFAVIGETSAPGFEGAKGERITRVDMSLMPPRTSRKTKIPE